MAVNNGKRNWAEGEAIAYRAIEDGWTYQQAVRRVMSNIIGKAVLGGIDKDGSFPVEATWRGFESAWESVEKLPLQAKLNVIENWRENIKRNHTLDIQPGYEPAKE